MRRELTQIVFVMCLASLPFSTYAQSSESLDAAGCPDFGSGQTEFHTTVAELNLAGDPPPRIAKLEQIMSQLKGQDYRGSTESAVSEIEERAKSAWLDQGYIKVKVRADARVLTASPINQRVSITLNVEEGKQYRLAGIRFENNHAITNSKALRNLFSLKDGEVLSRLTMADGLENLRRAYGEFGYANATTVPKLVINDSAGTISLTIAIDEGKQFYVSDINVIGMEGRISENLLRSCPLQRGQVYNQRLAEMFFNHPQASLPAGVLPSSRIHLDLDEDAGSLAITFDLRNCRQGTNTSRLTKENSR